MEEILHILVGAVSAIAVLAVKALADKRRTATALHVTERPADDLRTLVREGFKNVNLHLEKIDKDALLMHQRYHELSNQVAAMSVKVELLVGGRIAGS